MLIHEGVDKMRTELTKRERDTLRSIRICREGGVTDPSGRDLANVMGCHRTAVYMSLTRLRRKGYLDASGGIALSRKGDRWLRMDRGHLEMGGNQFFNASLKTLTDKQRAILDYMAEHLRKNLFIPTYREMAERFDINVSGVGHHIQSIIKKGWLVQSDNRVLFTDASRTEYGLFMANSPGSILQGEIMRMSPNQGDVIFIKVPGGIAQDLSRTRERLQRELAPSGITVVILGDDVQIALENHRGAKLIINKLDLGLSCLS